MTIDKNDKKAIIVGCKGQDGQLLYDFLCAKKYDLVGIARNSIQTTIKGWNKKINISNSDNVAEIIRVVKPDEIYYLPAFHHSSENKIKNDGYIFQESYKVHVSYLINFLEAIKEYMPSAKLFYAASSHIFGKTKSEVQNEETPIQPNCIYGITKAAGLFVCRFYREKYSLFASAGILYNHESPLRHQKFVSKKIIRSALNIKEGEQDKLVLGDLSAIVDWGYAPNYVDAMHRMLNYTESDDFIIATGVKHSVLDFVKIVFNALSLDWKKYIKEEKKIITKNKTVLIGDSNKLKTKTGWKPTVDFNAMVKILLAEEIKRDEQK